jgi:hypothetical protein
MFSWTLWEAVKTWLVVSEKEFSFCSYQESGTTDNHAHFEFLAYNIL